MRAGLVVAAIAAMVSMAMAAPPAQAQNPKDECRTVGDSLQLKWYADNQADRSCALEQVTTSMTLLLALEAQEDGLFKDDDVLPITEYSTRFPCPCLGAYATESKGTESSYVQAGERLRWDDLLTAVAMGASEPAATVAEAVARKRLEAAGTPTFSFVSQTLVAEFTKRMNARTKSFISPDAVFSGPHGSKQPGIDQGSSADARTVSQIWRAGLRLPTFQQHVSVRDKTITATTAGGQARTYRFRKDHRYAPGVTGDLRGGPRKGAQDKTCCTVSQATRVGRPLIAVVLGSADARAAIRRLLQRAQQALFAPRRTGSDATAGGPGSGAPDLVCAGKYDCLVLETRKGRLIGRHFTAGKQESAKELPGTSGTTAHALTALDGGAYDAALIRRSGGGVEVRAVQGRAAGGPVLGPPAPLGAGTGPVAVVPFGKGRVLAAHAASGGVRLTLLTLDPATGAFTAAAPQTLPATTGDVIALSKVNTFLVDAAVAYQVSGGKVRVETFRADGAGLASRTAKTLPIGKGEGLREVTDVVATGVQKFVVAGRSKDGRLTNVLMTLENGTTTYVKTEPTSTRYKASRVAGASLGLADGWAFTRVLSLSKGSLRVETVDPVPGFTDRDQLLSAYTGGKVKAIGGIQRLATDTSEGSYVVAVRGASGRTKLITLRAGSREQQIDPGISGNPIEE